MCVTSCPLAPTVIRVRHDPTKRNQEPHSRTPVRQFVCLIPRPPTKPSSQQATKSPAHHSACLPNHPLTAMLAHHSARPCSLSHPRSIPPYHTLHPISPHPACPTHVQSTNPPARLTVPPTQHYNQPNRPPNTAPAIHYACPRPTYPQNARPSPFARTLPPCLSPCHPTLNPAPLLLPFTTLSFEIPLLS